MNTRRYNKEDYKTLDGWWRQYSEWKDSVPELILPPYGAIVEHEGKPVAAAFLYETKGNGCSWMEWIVADPAADKMVRAMALDKLIDDVSEYAKNEGYQFVFMTVKHPKLLERLIEKGFMKGDGDMTTMIKKVQ